MRSVKDRRPVCRRCKDERENHGLSPREVVHLPAEVTEAEEFNNKVTPVVVCEHCDMSTLQFALKAHGERTGKYDASGS